MTRSVEPSSWSGGRSNKYSDLLVVICLMVNADMHGNGGDQRLNVPISFLPCRLILSWGCTHGVVARGVAAVSCFHEEYGVVIKSVLVRSSYCCIPS